MQSRSILITLAGILLVLLAACSTPSEPEIPMSYGSIVFVDDGDLRIAAYSENLGDLTDPQNLAKYTRADILIVKCSDFWGRESNEGKLELLRAAKPELKIIGYFHTKAARVIWGDHPEQTYTYDLYNASRPYWSFTTTGDTLMDWPQVAVFDYTNPDARRAVLDVFVKYQESSSNKFDGVYWDYFNPQLWIAPAVDSMTGEPDMDGDGVAHWDDADELARFQDAQYDWLHEMQTSMGPHFIQIANGARAMTDSLFARELDGIFYELFPNVGFGSGDTFRRALDVNRYNNLFAARKWVRSTNGGPWLILSHRHPVSGFQTEDGTWQTVDPGDLLRAVALLTDGTAVHYDYSGWTLPGIPTTELDLGKPLGGVEIIGDRYSRDFERGRLVLEMGVGYYPNPLSYAIHENGALIDDFGQITADP